MTEKIKEALAALVRLTTKTALGLGSGIENDAAIVRAALEAAQQEAEAWEAIETYCRERCSHLILDCEQGYDWSIVIGDPDRISPHTRLEALTNAAAWCRAEPQKADQ